MSDILKWFLPLPAFGPDRTEFGAETLRMAKNVTPMFETHRPLRQLEDIGEQSSSEPVIGAHVHLSSLSKSLVFMRPDSDIQDGGWYTPDGESQDDLHEEINEFEADISDFLIAAADASELQVGLSVPDVLPTANTDHKIKVYYQVFNVTGAWTIRLTLKTPGGEITHDISGSDSMDSYEFDTWDIPTVDVTTLLT